MKRLLLILALLVPYAGATAFTASISGDWNTPATWGLTGTPTCHTNIPCMTDSGNAGDTVTMNDTLTITCGTTGSPETCSVGTSPTTNATVVFTQSHTSPDNGNFSVGAGSTFIYAGSVYLYSGSFTIGAGATIQYDSSWSSAPTTAIYYWLTRNASYTPVQWSVNGTSGSHVTWQGDSSFSANAKPTICAAGACLAGAIGYTGSGQPSDEGMGTYTYFDVENVLGQANSGAVLGWYLSTASSSSSYGGITMSNITVTNTGTLRMIINGTGAVNSIAVSSLSFLNCSASTNTAGCFQFGSAAAADTGTGTYTITGVTADGPVNQLVSATFDPFVVTNTMLWAGSDGANPNLYPGIQALDGMHWDQLFIDINAWNTGASESGNDSSHEPPNISNSTFWQDRVVPTATHMHAFKMYENSANNTGTVNVVNNVWGVLGNADASGIGAGYNGGTPSVATTFNWNGNVDVCGYAGQGITPMAGGGAYMSNGNTASATIYQSGNTYCNTQNPTVTVLSGGAMGFETASSAAGTFASVDSNIGFCNVASGCNMSMLQSPADSSAANAVTFLGNNGVVNVATYTQIEGSGFVVTSAADKTISGRLPAFVEPGRALPLFDTEFLIPSGILALSSYSVVGAWTSGTSYTVGQVVSLSNSGVYGGKTTYWRCTKANTAGTTNEPVLGVDASNPFETPTAYWEEAFLAFMRTQVLANTTYDSYCAGLLWVSCPSPHTYITGLLNAWLRQGMTSMETTLWVGCLSGKECGAVPLKPIQHLPPPAGVL